MLYFSVIVGGGVAAPLWPVDPLFWPGQQALDTWHPAILKVVVEPTFAQAAAFLGAAVALPDAAWRPARSWLDTVISWICAGLAVGAIAYEPELFSPGYGTLAALAIGDAIAAFGIRRVRQRARAVQT